MATSVWRCRGERHELDLQSGAAGARLEVDGQGFRIDDADVHDPDRLRFCRLRFCIDGQSVSAWARRRPGAQASIDVWVGGVLQRFEEASTVAGRAAGVAADGRVLMPMTATLRTLHVSVGDAVEAGALLAVVEAMKMEIPLRAPAAARVASVSAAVGDIIEGGALLLTLEPRS